MDRLARALPWTLATLLFAALTHFVATLILPAVATRDAYDKLLTYGKADTMVLLPKADTGTMPIPFRDPATVQGVCFFDLAGGPVRVKARVEEGRLLTLSFRTRDGKVFYAMTDRAALRDTIDIRLVNDEQLESIKAQDDENQDLSPELRLKSPSWRGMIVATALVARSGDWQDAESRIKAIDCRREHAPQQ